MERTLVIFKPDAIQRNLAGQLLTRFDNKGFRMIGCKFMAISKDLAIQHYGEHDGKPFFPALIKFITSGPVLVLAFEGIGAIAAVRKLIGATNPSEAVPGTIRADFAQFRSHNLIHASDGAASAARELALFFRGKGELIDYERSGDFWNFGLED